MIAATLANGGRNPIDGRVAVTQPTVRQVLAVMASCGMYDGAGRWIVSVGLPAKSGVSGGIIAVLPGQLGVAVFSPRLDPQGNSARGASVCRDLAATMGLHLVTSGRPWRTASRSCARWPTEVRAGSGPPQRSNDSARWATTCWRSCCAATSTSPTRSTPCCNLIETQHTADRPARFVIVDLSRTDIVHESLPLLLMPIAQELADRGGSLVIAGIDDDLRVAALRQFSETVTPIQIVGTLDAGLEWCEDQLLAD